MSAQSARRPRLLCLFGVLLALAPGCASLMSGTQQQVRIDTHPDAKTLVDGRTFVGSSSVQLSRRGQHVVRVEKSGFRSRNVTLSPNMNGWVWGNLVLGPLFPIGVIIDALSGAIHDLTPTQVRVSLEAEAPPPAPEPPPVPAATKTPTPPEPSRRWVLAVMEIERLRGDDPADDLLRALSERLRVRLAETRWHVIDRTAQETRWSEVLQGEKHRSYRTCDDPSCQIPLGRALAASHLLRSSISRFGDTCVFGAELVELEAEVTVAAGSTQGPCDELSLLESADNLLKRLDSSASRGKSGEPVQGPRGFLDPATDQR